MDAAAPLLFDVFARLGPRPVPLPPAPPGTLDVAQADLPAPLRRFGPQLGTDREAPKLTFPPEGATLRPVAGRVLARVDRGRAPFTWFANGAPVLTRSFERAARLPLSGPALSPCRWSMRGPRGAGGGGVALTGRGARGLPCALSI